MKRWVRLIKRFVYDNRRYVFYRYDAHQGPGAAHDTVSVYDSWSACPAAIRDTVLGSRWLNVMYYRWRRGEARLLCYCEDGLTVQAFGWIQSWRPFRRKFGMLAQEGTMLGPYQTAPQARGRGLYGILLSHSLWLCDKEKPILIYTDPDNEASQKGISKAGFQYMGDWTVRTWLGCFTTQRKVSG